MNLKYIGLFILLTAVLYACKIAQPYQQPAYNTGNLYRDNSTTDTTTIANLSWQQMFSDVRLQALIQEGINNNLDLKVATARIKTAAANVKQSRLALLPTLDANA